jgi:hypothetical protein
MYSRRKFLGLSYTQAQAQAGYGRDNLFLK